MLTSVIGTEVLMGKQWIFLLDLNLIHRRGFYVCYCNLVPKLMAGDIIGSRVEPTIITFLNDDVIIILSK